MRGISWLLVLLAMAMFTVGCNGGPATPPPGAVDAPTTMDVDVDYEEPLEEPETEQEVEEEAEPADEADDESEAEAEEEDTES